MSCQQCKRVFVPQAKTRRRFRVIIIKRPPLCAKLEHLQNSFYFSPLYQAKSMKLFVGALKVVNDSSKYVVTSVALYFLIFRFSAEVCWILVGALLVVVVNKILKFIVKQARPETSRKQDFGMPSSHANITAYYASMISSYSGSLTIKICLQFISIFVAWMRVRLGYHTKLQVIVGYIVGTIFGVIWAQLGFELIINYLANQKEILHIWRLFTYVGGLCFVAICVMKEFKK
eukprot:TRINITY_DN10284_c1_g2_i2.p1 TRINITY_DN10284_c1_g2~~TRINITY_DN10284_c1_g2_i2.p1  ORF type:complete len:231 (-),score=0.87 TRINITY_DN10284_c1_g2_i2:240-932(-)